MACCRLVFKIKCATTHRKVVHVLPIPARTNRGATCAGRAFRGIEQGGNKSNWLFSLSTTPVEGTGTLETGGTGMEESPPLVAAWLQGVGFLEDGVGGEEGALVSTVVPAATAQEHWRPQGQVVVEWGQEEHWASGHRWRSTR